MSKKYKIEITRTCTVTMTFEVEADDRNTAIDRAEQHAYNEEWHMESGDATYESAVIEEPGECPDCGEPLSDEPHEGRTVNACNRCNTIIE